MSRLNQKYLIPFYVLQIAMPVAVFADHNNDKCADETFFGLPHWGKGLHFDNDCNIQDFSLNDIWVVVANVTRMALFLAGLLSVVFIVIGGLMFITSTGNPDQVGRARKLLTNAAIGLVVAILASTIVGYVAGFFS